MQPTHGLQIDDSVQHLVSPLSTNHRQYLQQYIVSLAPFIFDTRVIESNPAVVEMLCSNVCQRLQPALNKMIENSMHLQTDVRKIRRRFVFDTRNEPELPQAPTAEVQCDILGLQPAEYPLFQAEWVRYCELYQSHRSPERWNNSLFCDPVAFWSNQQVKNLFPLMASKAKAALSLPTSSISVERAFALMRHIRNHLSHRMSVRTLEIRLMTVYNKNLIDARMHDLATALALHRYVKR